MHINLDTLSPAQAYFHMTQTLVPRPIAWVLSDNGDGSYNLAPFSYFNAVCSDPPLLMLSIGNRPDGTPKDTRLNIEAQRKFVVHIAHAQQLPALNESSASLPRGESEVSRQGLALCDFDDFPLPRLADCRIAFACECEEVQEIGNQRQGLIFGRIRTIYVDDGIIHQTEQGRIKIDTRQLDPLARLGASEYLVRGEVVSLRRPD